MQQVTGLTKQSTVWPTTGKMQNGNVDEQNEIIIAYTQFLERLTINLSILDDTSRHVLSINEKISKFRQLLHEICEKEILLKKHMKRIWCSYIFIHTVLKYVKYVPSDNLEYGIQQSAYLNSVYMFIRVHIIVFLFLTDRRVYRCSSHLKRLK